MNQLRLRRDFFLRPSIQVARDLVGCMLQSTINGETAAVRIVETEAYPSDDPASHIYMRSPTARTSVQLLPGGHLYLYSMHGYIMTSIVTGVEGTADVVFIRSAEPFLGIDIMKNRRGYFKDDLHDLTNGPGKVSKVLGINMNNQGLDISLDDSPIVLFKTAPTNANVLTGERINIGVGKADPSLTKESLKRQWRFYLQESRFLSK